MVMVSIIDFESGFCGLEAVEAMVVYFRCGSCGLVLVVVVVVDFWSKFCGLEVVPWWYLIWGWVLWIGGCSGGGGGLFSVWVLWIFGYGGGGN